MVTDAGAPLPTRPVVVVCACDTPLSDVLPRLGEGGGRALAEGRVFVGSQRAHDPEQLVRRGEEVIAYPPRVVDGAAARILLQRGGLVAAYKPAAMATIADHRGRAGTLADEVAHLLGVPCERLHATSRLDVGVSGVVLFAADEATRSALARARELGTYVRHYIAIASGAPTLERGMWSMPIGRDADPRKRRVAGQRAVAASTAYGLAARTERAALLGIEPRTGRTHQIRVHAADAGCALWGDAAYRGPVRLISARGVVQVLSRIMLHAAYVEVPYGGEAVRVDAPLPGEMADAWASLGGSPTDWERAWTSLGSRADAARAP